ncbi:MAG: dihydroneopterin aldolase [Bradymonadia bacterium]
MMKKTVIGIDNLQVDCLIGVWSHERKIEQRIRVDIEVECDVTAAATTDELAHTLNYASVARDVAFLLKKCQFYLLESAALAIQRWLLTPTLSDKQPSVQAVFVKLTKFSALPGEALASVRGRMTRDDFTLDHETKEWGTVDIVFETPRMGIYRLNIDAGRTLPAHHHEVMREAELVLADGLIVFGPNQPERELTVGEHLAWPKRHVHGYRNSGTQTASLLCVDSPPFIPQDEIEWRN